MFTFAKFEFHSHCETVVVEDGENDCSDMYGFIGFGGTYTTRDWASNEAATWEMEHNAFTEEFQLV